MKKLFTLSLILISSFYVSAQNPHCDSLDIVDLGLNPFNPEELLLHVENNNQLEIFSYPSFKLLNSNNDTVASETPNFFGIGTTSIHNLGAYSQSVDPNATFNGTLLLYMNFEDSLVCSFPISESLLPDTGCTELILTSTDYSGDIGTELLWDITDENDSIVKYGVHDYNHSSPISISDTFCLKNGCYTLTIRPFANIAISGNSDISISYLGHWVSVGAQMQSGSTIFSLDFNVYYCDSTIVGIKAPLANSIQISPNPTSDFINVSWDRTDDFKTLEIMDISGRVIHSEQIRSKSFYRYPADALPQGVYLLRFIRQDGMIITRKVVKG